MHGRIEAIINNELITGRSNLFVLAPESKSIGDKVDASIPLPKRIAKYGVNADNSPGVTDKDNSISSETKTVNTSPKRSSPLTPKIRKTSTSDAKEHKAFRHPIHILVDSKPLQKKNIHQHPSSNNIRNNHQKPPYKRVSGVTHATDEKAEQHELPKISLDKIFYWSCGRCTIHNSYKRSRCSCCGGRKSTTAKMSALLEVADNAMFSAMSIDDALRVIPSREKSTIPVSVLFFLMKLQPTKPCHIPPKELPLETFFKWNCAKCTATNSYSAQKCIACESYRSFACEYSK